MSATTTQADAILIAAAIRRAGEVGKRQRVFFDGSSNNNATVNPTTDTVNYSTGWSFTTDKLPEGIYVVRMTGSALFGHNAAGSVDTRNMIAGVAQPSQNNGVTVDTVTRFVVVNTVTEVEVTIAGLTLTFQYKAGTAGTVNAKSPFILLDATLVGE